jgi:hypothetical protein
MDMDLECNLGFFLRDGHAQSLVYIQVEYGYIPLRFSLPSMLSTIGIEVCCSRMLDLIVQTGSSELRYATVQKSRSYPLSSI